MKKLLALAAMMATTGAANAAVISFNDSYGLATTDWSHNLTLTQFNSSLGTLNSVLFEYSGQVDTGVKVESLNATPATVTANSSASLTFGLPISDVLNIAGNNSVNLGAFDNIMDFGGTSGHDFGIITATDAASLLLSSSLGAYIGTGSYTVSVDAKGKSSATGAGNLLALINTQALADIKVTYDYTPTATSNIPEPASLALMGLGLAGLGAMRRHHT